MCTVQDDIDQELLPLFLEEAQELHPQVDLALRAWREQPGDVRMARKLQRTLHTLKGSARMAGVMRLGELAHHMEEQVAEAPCAPSFWDDLQKNFDRIGSLIGQLQTDLSASMAPNAASGTEECAAQATFAYISRRLYQVARQTAKELGKKVNLELPEGETRLERSLLERMTAPFEHMLRNAIAHGLESPEKRRAKGKPPMGEVRLSLRQEKHELIFEFSDDGAGLDIARLRQRAKEQGMLQAGMEPGESQTMQLIFVSGLSTASCVTEISGRGVGMDVVQNEITALGGHIEIASERNKGTRFVIRLPLALPQEQMPAGTIGCPA